MSENRIKELAVVFLDDGWFVRLCGENKDAIKVIDADEEGEFVVNYFDDEKIKYSISFTRNTHPGIVKWVIDLLNEKKIDFELFECYGYDSNKNMVWKSDEIKKDDEIDDDEDDDDENVEEIDDIHELKEVRGIGS